jgi:hypothetical protein
MPNAHSGAIEKIGHYLVASRKRLAWDRQVSLAWREVWDLMRISTKNLIGNAMAYEL